jgi:phosphohistidine phosphatase
LKTLLLLRHAKSSWSNPSLQDFDRPLNARGEAAAVRVGGWLRESGRVPELVLSSTARRAVETWKGVAEALEPRPEVRWVPSLYLAEPDHILDRIHALPGTVSRALLVGHNPGIEDLARSLARKGDPTALRELRTKYPTGGLALLTFEVDDWQEVAPRTGRLELFRTPRSPR